MVSGEVDTLRLGLQQVLRVSQVAQLRRLSGGASRETWRFTADGADMVLQRVRQGAIGGLRCEPAVLVAAHHVGVLVPELVIDGSHRDELERPFMIVRAVEGETIARKILRDEKYSVARKNLPRQLGQAAALLHTIDAGTIPGLVEEDQMTRYREALDLTGEAHPVFEIAFRWLEANKPEASKKCVVHGDLRLGNILVNEQGLAAVIDWELAHLGDPMEDLGWLCVRAWRFGGKYPVAGLGTYQELFDAYEEVSGIRPDSVVVRWWETLGTLKWGIMCIGQAQTHLKSIVRSHELAAIGRRVCENEYDLLELIGQKTQ